MSNDNGTVTVSNPRPELIQAMQATSLPSAPPFVSHRANEAISFVQLSYLIGTTVHHLQMPLKSPADAMAAANALVKLATDEAAKLEAV